MQLISFSYAQLSPGFQPGLFHGPQGRTGPLLKSSDVSLGRLAVAAGGLALSAVFALAASVGRARANGAEPSPLSVVQALMDAELLLYERRAFSNATAQAPQKIIRSFR